MEQPAKAMAVPVKKHRPLLPVKSTHRSSNGSKHLSNQYIAVFGQCVVLYLREIEVIREVKKLETFRAGTPKLRLTFSRIRSLIFDFVMSYADNLNTASYFLRLVLTSTPLEYYKRVATRLILHNHNNLRHHPLQLERRPHAVHQLPAATACG